MPEWYSPDWFRLSTLKGFVWANPWYLYSIAAIPLLFLLRWIFYTQSRQKLHLSVVGTSLQGSWFTWLRYLIPLFFILGMITVLMALARPQLLNENKEQYAEGIDIVLGIDISESMLFNDLKPNRLEAAKQVATNFISGRNQDRIGLVAFAGESVSLSPLTTDYEMLNEYLGSLNSDLIRTSGTAIGNALASCINRLRDVSGTSKVAIIISDGDNTAGSLDPMTAVELARTFGIRVYTIAIGKNNQKEIVDERTLRQLAREGNGQFFRATDETTLQKIFDQIDKFEKNQIKKNVSREVSDYYYVYTNWAVCFFLLSFLLKNTFLGNVIED